jgi:hypothetical protein
MAFLLSKLLSPACAVVLDSIYTAALHHIRFRSEVTVATIAKNIMPSTCQSISGVVGLLQGTEDGMEGYNL